MDRGPGESDTSARAPPAEGVSRAWRVRASGRPEGGPVGPPLRAGSIARAGTYGPVMTLSLPEAECAEMEYVDGVLETLPPLALSTREPVRLFSMATSLAKVQVE
jgi:hypothetical protein